MLKDEVKRRKDKREYLITKVGGVNSVDKQQR